MLTKIDCFPCFLKQTVRALKQNSTSPEFHQEILQEVLDIISRADTRKPPAYTTTRIYRAIRMKLGADPFKKVKYEYNEIARGLYPSLKERVRKSNDPLWTATRLAIAGNIMDFGLFSSIDIESSIYRSLESTIAIDDYQSFEKAIHEKDEILYLLDNSGEIVFDLVLIEELVTKGKRIKAVVKGSPVINDVTYEDAVQSGLADACEVISNDSDAVGTILEFTSPEFKKHFDAAELILSKGQANFETLNDTEGRAFFLFQSKCDVLSDEMGLKTGSMLLKKS